MKEQVSTIGIYIKSYTYINSTLFKFHGPLNIIKLSRF